MAVPIFVFASSSVRLNAQLKSNRATQQITNHKLSNELLAGAPPHQRWEQFHML